MAAFTARRNGVDGARDAAANDKPRVMSLGGQYSAGPLYISAGYERHKESRWPPLPLART